MAIRLLSLVVGNSRTSGNVRDSPPLILLPRNQSTHDSYVLQVFVKTRQSAGAASSLTYPVTFWNYLRRLIDLSLS